MHSSLPPINYVSCIKGPDVHNGVSTPGIIVTPPECDVRHDFNPSAPPMEYSIAESFQKLSGCWPLSGDHALIMFCALDTVLASVNILSLFILFTWSNWFSVSQLCLALFLFSIAVIGSIGMWRPAAAYVKIYMYSSCVHCILDILFFVIWVIYVFYMTVDDPFFKQLYEDSMFLSSLREYRPPRVFLDMFQWETLRNGFMTIFFSILLASIKFSLGRSHVANLPKMVDLKEV